MEMGGASYTLPNGLRINFRVGHLDTMPRCTHGRVEGFCSKCEGEGPRLKPDEGGRVVTEQDDGVPGTQTTEHRHQHFVNPASASGEHGINPCRR